MMCLDIKSVVLYNIYIIYMRQIFKPFFLGGRGGGGEGVGKGGVKGLSSRAEVRARVRGEYGFSSLLKQNKKAKKKQNLLRHLQRRIFFLKKFML